MFPATREEVERIIERAKGVGKDTTELEKAIKDGTIDSLEGRMFSATKKVGNPQKEKWAYFSTGPPVDEEDFK